MKKKNFNFNFKTAQTEQKDGKNEEYTKEINKGYKSKIKVITKNYNKMKKQNFLYLMFKK